MKFSTASAILGVVSAAQAAVVPIQQRSADDLTLSESLLKTRAKAVPNFPTLTFTSTQPEGQYETVIADAWWEMIQVLNQMWGAQQLSVFTDMAAKYFGNDQKRIDTVIEVIGAIIGATPGDLTTFFPGNALLPKVDITNVRLKKDSCDEPKPPIMYTHQGTGVAIIRPCSAAFTEYPALLSTNCQTVERNGAVNGKMASLSAILFHEATHVKILTGSLVKGGIIDHGDAGYGPLHVHDLIKNGKPAGSIDPLTNADSYAWFFSEFYWTATCSKTYTYPTANTDYHNTP